MKTINWQRQHWRFVALLLSLFVLIGLLAVRYDRSMDITLSQRNELSANSVNIVKQLTQPLQVTAFVRGNPQVKKLVNRLLDKYRRHASLEVVFKNPDTAVDLVREYDISRDGELVFEYQGRRAHAADLSEASITRAIYQLLQSDVRRVLLVSGHGERGIGNQAQDYGALFERLQAADINVGQVDLKVTKKVPDNTDLLVVADARIDYSESENQAIKNYVADGGHLLWLAEPSSAALPALVSQLGLRVDSGTLINRSGKKYSLPQPDYVVIEPTATDLPLLAGINTMLLFPQSAPVMMLPTAASSRWQALPLLRIEGESFIKADNTIEKAPTPTLLGVYLTSSHVGNGQKIAVIGDADFLSNQFIGFGQNADFAMNLLSQLSAPDDALVHLNQSLPPAVIIPEATLGYLALCFILVLPMMLLICGLWLRKWLRGRV